MGINAGRLVKVEVEMLALRLFSQWNKNSRFSAEGGKEVSREEKV